MKYANFLAGLVLLFALGARAQENSQFLTLSSVSPADTAVASYTPTTFASVRLIPAGNLLALPEELAAAPSSLPLPQAGVQSVYQKYSFQAYAGYTFVRFYAFPGTEANRNGFDISMSYFLRGGIWGVEGALTTTFGSIANETSDFVLVGGGPRVRWSGPRGIELWAHGLVGDAHFGPRIPNFNQDALAYELGGGVDINAHFQRFAYRVEADMIGSRFYNTSQYSPKFSVGIVYKF